MPLSKMLILLNLFSPLQGGSANDIVVWRPHEGNRVKVFRRCVWWFMSVIPALRVLRQGNCEFGASLGYLVTSHL